MWSVKLFKFKFKNHRSPGHSDCFVSFKKDDTYVNMAGRWKFLIMDGLFNSLNDQTSRIISKKKTRQILLLVTSWILLPLLRGVRGAEDSNSSREKQEGVFSQTLHMFVICEKNNFKIFVWQYFCLGQERGIIITFFRLLEKNVVVVSHFRNPLQFQIRVVQGFLLSKGTSF